MRKGKSIALFDHRGCRTKFFARLQNSSRSLLYRGKCPNPSCNRTLSLYPEETYVSTDKARREYIKLLSFQGNRIYWQT